MRLRGRGRVRQGVCPFHDENEGSFTVYADSERFYCFGCGEGGDVLDFIQQRRGAEPDGGHRAAGRQPRACAQGRQLVQPERGVPGPPRCLPGTPPC